MSRLLTLTRMVQKNRAMPKYIITDKGSQFWCDGFKGWCKDQKVKPRFGAVGKYGSIAVLERFIRTLKNECTRVLDVLRADSHHNCFALSFAKEPLVSWHSNTRRMIDYITLLSGAYLHLTREVKSAGSAQSIVDHLLFLPRRRDLHLSGPGEILSLSPFSDRGWLNLQRAE